VHDLPDPDGVQDLDELVVQLRLLKVWAGDPSYDSIAQRIRPEPARKSTVADCFRLGRRRLDAELLLGVVEILHADSGYVARWQHALRVVTGDTQAAAYVSVEEVLPEDLTGFTGRTAELHGLKALLTRSRDDGDAVVISAIEGMAGVGKTRLAVHAGHLLAADDPFERVLFVNLRGFHDAQKPADPAAVLDGFLRKLRVPGHRIPAGLAARTALYRQQLAGSRNLVVLDNAATEEQVRPLLPQTAGCLTLITSRRSLTSLPGTTRFEVDVFSRDEAVGYLTRNLPDLPTGDDPTAAERIAERCGFLPLALSLVTAYIGTTTGWTLTDHADRLDERHHDNRLDNAVERALDLSYQNLPDQHRQMVRLLSLHPGADFDAYAAAALADTELQLAELTLEELARDHLLQQSAQGRYTFHDLVHAYAAVKAVDEERPGDRRAALTRLFDLYLGVASRTMDILHPLYAARRPKVATPSTPVPPLTEQSDAVDWLTVELDNLIAFAEHTSRNGWLTHASQLSITLGRHLMGVQGSGALTIHTCALQAAIEAGDGRSEAYVLNNLGNTRARLRQYDEAIAVHQRTLLRAREVGETLVEGWAHNALGIHFTQLINWAAAVEHFERGQELYQQLGDRLGQALVLSNLANIHKRTARYAEALAVLDQALAIYLEADEVDGVATVLTNVAVVMERQGRYPEALEHSRRAVEQHRRIGNRNGQARALMPLGVAELRIGSYDAASEHLEEALAIYRQLGNRGGESMVLPALGDLCAKVGKFAEAVDRYQEALAIHRETGGRDEECFALNGLGEVALASGRPELAVAHHTEALAGANEFDVVMEQARAHAGLGRAHRALGDHTAAAEHEQLAKSSYATMGVPPPA
jgi:tetratricopeptide (TPR) repeat protein